MQSEGVDITVNLKGLFLPALFCSLALNAAVLFLLSLIPGGASAEKADVSLPPPIVEAEEDEGEPAEDASLLPSAAGSLSAVEPVKRAGVASAPPVRAATATEAEPRARGGEDASETTDYVVRRGDNFTAIAKRHGLSPAELAELNGGALSKFSRLDIGQRLRVPKK